MRQTPGGARRRWFQDESMDLFVWLSPDDAIVGFQLAYDKPEAEKALTWRVESGFVHTRVDDGARPGRHPATPLLVADGVCDAARLLQLFEERAAELEPAVAAFVSGALRGFPKSAEPGAGRRRPAWSRALIRILRALCRRR